MRVHLQNRGGMLFGALIAVAALGARAAEPPAAPPKAAPPPPAPPKAAPPPAGEMIQFNFPENTEVKLLIDYISKRLGTNILYNEDILRQKKVTIESPTSIPKDSLIGLLQSVLKMSGLALAEGEQPGWKRVVPATDMAAAAHGIQTDPKDLAAAEPGTPVTQVFQLKNASLMVADRAIRPLLSKPGGNAFPVQNSNLLLVSDYASHVRQVAALVDFIDRPGRKVSVRFLPVKNTDAGELAKQANTVLTEREKLASPDGKGGPRGLTLIPDSRTGQIVMLAAEGAEDQALELIKALDVPDLPTGAGDVRFYRLLNTTAAAVLATIRAMESTEKGLPPPPPGEPLAPATVRAVPGEAFPGPNVGPGQPGAALLPKPPGFQPAGAQPGAAAEAPKYAAGAAAQPGAMSVKLKDATITADPNTNSIIVIGPPAAHNLYKQLITILDKKRPQVMIEVTLVTLDSTGSLSLGVEFSHANDPKDEGQTILSSLFGLSKMDAATGALTLLPSAGLNAALLGPDRLNAVMQTLSMAGRSKVISAPRILVNDNATATLTSIAEFPYTSLNASDVVATTSFAGYATAGVTITVTPHISEGDHLQLQYTVTLNNFTDKGSNGVPPPRETNALNSEVTVPDGYTVVVGGLGRRSRTESVSRVPILGELPFIKFLFRSATESEDESLLFAFIRPVILRDDQFEDLRYLSDRDLAASEMPANYPGSEPLILP